MWLAGFGGGTKALGGAFGSAKAYAGALISANGV